MRFYETINLSDQKYESKTKRFISLYNNLKSQGALDDEKVFEVALEQLNAVDHTRQEVLEDEVIDEPVNFGLVSSFTEASNQKKGEGEDGGEAPTPKPKKGTAGSIDIKSLF